MKNHVKAGLGKRFALNGQVLLRATVAYGLLNAPFWWLAHTNFLSRAWFNVDLLIPLVIARFSPIAALLSLAFFWILDAAVSQSLAWHFRSPLEFIRSVEFLPSVHVASYLSFSWLALLVPFVVSAALALWLVRRQRHTGSASFLILLLVASVDFLNGSTFIWVRAERLLPGNVGGSALKQVITAFVTPVGDKLASLAPGNSLTTQFDVEGWARAHPDRSVVVVLVESMGLHEDTRMRQWLRDQVFDKTIADRVDLKEMDVPFKGSTTSAEMRELCGLIGIYRELLTVTPTPSCLPARLASAGWETIGVHGFSSRMFMRGAWWPKLGLKQRLFAEDLALADEKRCGGAFVGLCDARMIDTAFMEARASKHFVYVLTLNSHLPLGEVTVPPDLGTICDQGKVGDGVCGFTSTIGIALRAVRAGIAGSDRVPLVLVVGDHAPPFSKLEWRNEFDQRVVPGFILVPRQ